MTTEPTKDGDASRHSVLIAGAGPTGLVLALWLIKQGVPVRIIDKASDPGTTSRAMALHSRTLELYRQLDLADAVIEAGHKTPSINLWVKGKRKAHVSFGNAGASMTPYPFVLVYPQDQHERLLCDRLSAMSHQVEWQTELVGLEDKSTHVVAHVTGPDGSQSTCEAEYLAGCDGASSTVRKKLNIGFPGGTYSQLFYVADIETNSPVAKGEAHLSLENADFAVYFPYGPQGRGRLIGSIRDERENEDDLTFDDVGQQPVKSLGLDVEKVNWFSTYRVHHRVASRFRQSSTLLLGDAAHIHSPAGGQGMNTGIGDAINLAWKLAAVVKQKAPDSLLDSYEIERMAFAQTLVKTTDRAFTFVTAEGIFADFIRTKVAPTLVSTAFSISAMREFMFRTVSQARIQYRHSPLSHGSTGSIKAGDRLPWVAFDNIDNYETLKATVWHIHIYGSASPKLAEWCKSRKIPLHVFPWHHEHKKAGIPQNAAYLIRPDTYIALATGEAEPSIFQEYFEGIGYGIE